MRIHGGITFAADWKLLTVFPSDFPRSGSFDGPKMSAATPAMTTSSPAPRPNRPMVVTAFREAKRGCCARGARSASALPTNALADACVRLAAPRRSESGAAEAVAVASMAADLPLAHSWALAR